MVAGLYDALCRNPELCCSVLDSLLDHFNQFYQPDQATLPPLDIGKAVTIQGADIAIQVQNVILVWVCGHFNQLSLQKVMLLGDSLICDGINGNN